MPSISLVHVNVVFHHFIFCIRNWSFCYEKKKPKYDVFRFLVSPITSIGTIFQVAIAGLHFVTGFGTLGSTILMASLDTTKVRDAAACGRTHFVLCT
jgi:hypothetical protein